MPWLCRSALRAVQIGLCCVIGWHSFAAHSELTHDPFRHFPSAAQNRA